MGHIPPVIIRHSQPFETTREFPSMNIKDAIKQAVGAHGIWKSRLRTAIQTGKLDMPVEQIASESTCDFGKWLLSPEMSSELSKSNVQNVRKLHAQFHRIAGRAAEFALSGKRTEAENLIADGGEYVKVSTELTLALKAWRESGSA